MEPEPEQHREIVAVRTMREDERVFILDSWRRSYTIARAVRGVPLPDYHDAMKRTVDSLLLRPTVQLHVACAHGTPNVLVGWAAGERGRVLHYVYVKQGYRRQGVASVLWRALGSPRWASCDTFEGIRFLARHDVTPSPVFLLGA